MKILFTLICSLCLFVSTALASSDNTDRWLLVGKDSPNKNEWFIDNKTLKINDNKSVAFWAKVVLHNPKYDIKEIKLKYLLSPDQLQLTKLQEIGYSKNEEILWNNNVTKTISVIPGSGHEKLIIFIDGLIREKDKKQKENNKEQIKEHSEKTAATAVSGNQKEPLPENKTISEPQDKIIKTNLQHQSEQQDKAVKDKSEQQPEQQRITEKPAGENTETIKKETL